VKEEIVPALFQRPHTAHFILAERFKRRFRHGDMRQRLTQRVEHFGSSVTNLVTPDKCSVI